MNSYLRRAVWLKPPQLQEVALTFLPNAPSPRTLQVAHRASKVTISEPFLHRSEIDDPTQVILAAN